MSKSWYVAPALLQWRKETDALWPERNKASDGFLGDAAHSARDSQHNPNDRGSVNACDTGIIGIDPYRLVNVAIKDSRTWYVIYNHTIWSRTNNFRPQKYNGVNGHEHHVHVSILTSVTAENDTRPWGFAPTAAPTAVSSKDEIVTKDEVQAIADAILNKKVTANGVTDTVLNHLVKNFVYDKAQSTALAEIRTMLKALAR